MTVSPYILGTFPDLPIELVGCYAFQLVKPVETPPASTLSGYQADCSQVEWIPPESAEGQRIGNQLLNGLIGNPTVNQVFHKVGMIEKVSGWVIYQAQFTWNYSAMFVLIQKGDEYEYFGQGWMADADPVLSGLKDIQQHLATRLPDAPPELIACVQLEPAIFTFPVSPADQDQARESLIRFFALLHTGQYEEANWLYGGDYQTLRENNPDLPGMDYLMLWQRACEVNGFQCLEIRQVLKAQVGRDDFKFTVEFENNDGTLFVRGLCCGANETQMPSESRFTYTVFKTYGRFVVRELPVYVP